VKIGNTFRKSQSSERWPQEKQYEREKAKRQQCFEALFADP
jgi:hypothetical protein